MTFAVLLTGNPVNALGKGIQGGNGVSIVIGVVDARQNAGVFTWGGVSFITASYENDRCARSIGGE